MARQKEFDRDVALDRGMTAFWSRGYAATSIEYLVAHMGIQRGSLYATFGDKRSLFLSALDRYQRVVVRELFEALEAPGSGLEAIRRFFRLRVERSLDRSRPPGCLVTNSAVELSRRAQEKEKERDLQLNKYHYFEYASAALQIGIVLCSAAVITSAMALVWLAGATGLIGIAFMVMGFFFPYVHLLPGGH